MVFCTFKCTKTYANCTFESTIYIDVGLFIRETVFLLILNKCNFWQSNIVFSINRMEFNPSNQLLKNQDKLFRFSLSLTRNQSDAEDVYQETLIKIWELKDEWDTWQNFEAYTMRMVRNTFLNFKKKNNNRAFVDIDDIVEIPQQNDIDQKNTLIDLRMKFDTLVRRLPEIQRNILHLREIEELEYKEIGEILDISESQVKVYLFRGRQYIKNKLNGTR